MDGAAGDTARLLRFADYELLEARFVRHRFGLHTHDSFVLAVVDSGVECLRVDGVRLVAYPGDVVVLSPGEAHDGAAHDAAGFAYRAVYPSQGLVAGTFELPRSALQARCFARNVIVDPAVADRLRAAHHRLARMGDPLGGESALVAALSILWDRYGVLSKAISGRAAEAGAIVARDLIESRVAGRVSLLELARACEMTPIGVLRAFGDAWARGDLAALMGFVTDDCVYTASVGPEPGTTYQGRDQVRRGFAEMLAYDRGWERHGGLVVVAGGVGFAEWSFTEVTPDGRRRTIRGCDLFEFRDGQISKKDAFRKVLGPVTPGPGYRQPGGPDTMTTGSSQVTALGRQVKEMIGGLEYWIREGHPTEGKRPVAADQATPSDWGLVA